MSVSQLAKFLLENFAPDAPVYMMDEYGGVTPVVPSQFEIAILKYVTFMNYERQAPGMYLGALPAHTAIDTVKEIPSVIVRMENNA